MVVVMTAAQLAAAELESLLADPRLQGRWRGGFTTDDVLAELHRIGRVRLGIRDGALDAEGIPSPEYAVALVLRGESDGRVLGKGRTLTAAAVRCLLEAEADLADEVLRGLASIDDLLATDNP